MTGRLLILAGSMVVGFSGPLACSDDGQILGQRVSSGGSSASGGSSGSNSSGGSSGSNSSGGSGAQSGSSGAQGGSSTGGASGATTGGSTATGGASGASTGGVASSGAGGTTAGTEAVGGSSGSVGGGGANTGGAGGTAGTTSGGVGGAGSSAGGTGGASSTPCVNVTCMPGEACVATRTVGGPAIFPDDAGTCPVGLHAEGNRCAPAYGYRCVTEPRCTGAAITCSCADCPSPYNSCRAATPSEWLDSDAKLACEQLAP